MDTTKKAPPNRRDNAVFWICLPLAGILWFFAGGRYVVGAAAWLAPVFMLRWFRGRRGAVAFPLAVLAGGTAAFFAWRGIADVMMPTAFYVFFSAAAAAVYLLPYLADRALYRHPGGFPSTLIFPAAVVTLEYVLSLVSPLGTWNAVAYTQVGNLPLIQISSLTGIHGVSFVVAWFAAVANWAWEERVAGRDIGRGLAAYAAVLAAVMLFGGIRLAVTRADDTVRVAGIVARTFFLSEHREVLEPLIEGEPLAEEVAAAMREETAAINDDLFARSAREARAGAKIVLWGEASAQLLLEDERALVARGRDLARRERVYLGMALATLEPGADKPVTNKFVLVDPGGNVVWDYVKAVPVPGPEDAISRRGDRVIPTVETEYGKLAGVICYDMDFPAMIRPAGRAGADIMLVPAHDWYELGDLHADLAVFRAVENGFSLLRPDNEAVSVATDYLGRPLAATDYFATDDPVIVADIPTAGVRTVYAGVGDVFAWLVILYLGTTTIIILIRLLRKTNHRNKNM
jgi:apolipoprotein N-acyltransferase